MDTIDRSYELADLVTRTDGGDRVIEAYAAVFDTATEVTDRYGHYHERISRSAFDVTIRDRGDRLRVLFNHGKDLYGNPSERFSMPIGVPVSVKPDGRGLHTVTRVSNTPLGDEVYTLAQDGAITGFSFTGDALKSNRIPPATSDGLATVERTEIRLREYGPGVFHTYPDARILAVRAEDLAHASADELAELVAGLGEEQRQLLTRALLVDDAPAEGSAPSDPGGNDDPPPRQSITNDQRRTALRLRGIIP